MFEGFFKPTVERFNYTCRRSTATRGSLIKGIIQDLDSAWVVLADLTDRNANVFYELGVRHALQDRTILVAQRREDIPSDLTSYANHVYDWKSEEGREAFASKMADLFADVDKDPDRADNPVSDFLDSVSRKVPELTPSVRLDGVEDRLQAVESSIRLLGAGPSRSEAREAISAVQDLPILTPGDTSQSWFRAGAKLARELAESELRILQSRIKAELRESLPATLNALEVEPPTDRMQLNDVAPKALEYEAAFAPYLRNIECLAYGLSTADWKPGASAILSLGGSLISNGDGGSGLKFIVGLPSFFAWRLVCACGAISLARGADSVACTLINDPIPVSEPSGRRTLRPLTKHRDLFYPTALLGYADLGVKSIASMHDRTPHLALIFHEDAEFRVALAEFLILVALRDAKEEGGPMYPSYRLIAEARDGLANLMLGARSERRRFVADALGVAESQLDAEWARLAEVANTAELGREYRGRGLQIPTDLNVDEF